MSDHGIAVVGGGLAGLEATRRLAAAGHEVTLYEAEATVGGRVRTKEVDGFTLDRGFQVLFTAYPEAQRALDLDALDLRRFPPGGLVCRRNSRSLIADPVREPLKAVEAALSRELTLGDKMRTLRLKRRLAGTSRSVIFTGPDESIDRFLRNAGFSECFIDSFAAPFYGGITLDRSLSTSKRVFEFTFTMLSEGFAAVPAAGMGAIPAQLAERASDAGAEIVAETAVADISGADPVTLDLGGETVTADAVIVAAGPESSRSLTGIEAIPETGRGTVTQYFTLPDRNPIGDQSHILLNAGGTVPNQVAVLSAVAPAYSPDDRILLSVSTPGHLDVDEDELARQTRVAVGSWYPEASFEELRLLSTVRIPFAQFDQPPGVHDTLPGVDAPDGPVFLAGDFTEDSSINGALRSGRLAADAVENVF